MSKPLKTDADRVSWCENFATVLNVFDSAHTTIEQRLDAIETKEPRKAQAMRDYFLIQDRVEELRQALPTEASHEQLREYHMAHVPLLHAKVKIEQVFRR